jgi:Ca2+-dependent lipid-binding protein
MRLKLKLINNYPYVQTAEFCFLEPPQLDFTLKPLISLNVLIDYQLIIGYGYSNAARVY